MVTLEKIRVPAEAPFFAERKAAEASVRIIRAAGGRVPLIRLMAMLYIVDRRLITDYGAGLTDDEYMSVQGLLAVPLELYHHASKLGVFDTEWHRRIECLPNLTVKALGEADPTALSTPKDEVIDAVAREYSGLEDETFVDRMRSEAPEIAEHAGERFSPREIFLALGDAPEEAEDAYQDWVSLKRVRYGRNVAPA